MNDTILINRLPTRTWNRLGVNETALTWGPVSYTHLTLPTILLV